MTPLARLLPVVLAAAAMVLPASAVAGLRFAGPAGSGSACTEAVPCTLAWAIGAAGDNDEIVVLPGDYTIDSVPASATGLFVHGLRTHPRPQITSTATGGTFAIALQRGSILTHVDLRITGESGHGVALHDASISNATLVAEGVGSPLMLFRASLAQNVAVRSTGGGSAIMVSGYGRTADVTARLRNVTAYAGGGPTAAGLLITSSTGPGSIFADVRSSILRGAANDISSHDPAGFVLVDHSNYRPATSPSGQIAAGAGNQASEPVFVDAATGGVHQDADSPTVDAGVVDDYSFDTDIDDDPRPMGRGPDIGADEHRFVPELATPTASDVTRTAATLRTTVMAGSVPTTYELRWGVGERCDRVAISGTTSEPTPLEAVAPLTGLQPGTTYSTCATATSTWSSITVGGEPFTTLPEQQPPPPPKPPDPQPPAPPADPPIAALPPRASVVPSVVADRSAPAIAKLVVPRTLRLARGATVRFTLSEAATVDVAVARMAGRKAVAVGTVRRAFGAGAQTLAIRRKIGKRTLRPGTHRLTFTAVDAAGNRSPAKRVTITVRR